LKKGRIPTGEKGKKKNLEESFRVDTGRGKSSGGGKAWLSSDPYFSTHKQREVSQKKTGRKRKGNWETLLGLKNPKKRGASYRGEP